MKPLVAALAVLAATIVPGLAINLSFLAWDEAVAERKLAVVSGGNLEDITQLHPLKRSPLMKANPNDAGEIVVRAHDRTLEGGKPAELSVKITGGIQRPLILLMPDPKAPTGLRGYAFEDSANGFPWGSYRILNVTGANLIMGLGRQKHALPSGWKPLDIPSPGDKPVPVFVSLAQQPDPPLYTNLWQPEPDVRRLVILIPGTDPRLGKLAVKVIPESRTAQTAE